MGLHNPNRIRKAQDLCKSNLNRRAYLKDPLSSYLNKEVEKENPNLRKLHKVFFLKFQPPHTKERDIVLYAFRFYNQAKSLAPTLKILLVFLCEVVANQLQQSNGCYGVSHILGSVQRKKSSTRSSPIGNWSKGSTVNQYFGIDLIMVRFIIFVTVCS